MSTGVVLSNVTKTYGPVRALLSVSIAFPVGSFSLVVGANGSGKSTLLSLLGTLTRPTTGRIDHGDFGANRHDVRHTLGWLGHDTLSYGDLTGRENLSLTAQLYRMDPRDMIAEATERFELGAFFERPVRTYSRGQRQRVALARALCHKPRLLLLDEPTTGLDAQGVRTLRRVVEEEQVKRVTIVLVTHDAAFAQELASQRIELERGRVRA